MESIFTVQKNKIDTSSGTGIALGNFDGLHLGHMMLINKVITSSQVKNLRSMVYTFRNHPENMIAGKVVTPVITPNEMKCKILKDTDLDYLYFEEFGNDLMHMDAHDFVKTLLIDQFNAKLIVVGYNYHFGYKGKGDIKLLEELGKKYAFDLHVIQPVILEKMVVSSTIIRKFISEGNVQQASKLMNRNYAIEGRVVTGKKLGRKIGFPTINMDISPLLLLPQGGVYVTCTVIGDVVYPSITNIGNNPTVGNKEIRMETHILDFNEDIYGQEVEVKFIKKIRDEKKFLTIGELKKQISLDVCYAREYFSKTIYNEVSIC